MPNSNTRDNRVHVVRNFIHHNERDGDGYGVNANSGGFPLIEGNTFVWNRHAIAATNSTEMTGYRAFANLVLSDVPTQYLIHQTHDFDIHGTDDTFFTSGRCGMGGGFFDIAWNTFLGDNRTNFEIRAKPCVEINFHNNVSLQEQADTVNTDFGPRLPEECGGMPGLGLSYNPSVATPWLHVVRNWFERPDPSEHYLGIGDFDGDGREDTFLATGAAFYYAPAGKFEWRLLASGRTDRIQRNVAGVAVMNLLFGDFDDDGRTDVVGKNGANLMVSWGGASEWEPLRPVSAPIEDLFVGDFDANGHDDIFWANGRNWQIAYGDIDGIEEFVPVATSGYRIRDLRFGDFNNNGTTDPFGIVDGQWKYSEGGHSGWARVGDKRAETLDNIYIGDFDGDGRDDVGHRETSVAVLDDVWEFSRNGTDEFETIAKTKNHLAAWGRFLEGSNQTALLFWDSDEHLDVGYVGAGGALEAHSRQDMR